MRRVAGRPLSVAQFVTALVITAVITEVSYRFLESPIRRGRVGRWWRRLQSSRDPAPRRLIAGAGAVVVALSVFAATNLATAQLKPNEIQQSLEEADDVDAGPRRPDRDADDGAGVRHRARPRPSPGRSAPSTPGATTAPTVATTTVPPTTAAPTTLPPPPPIVAIGDSVMLGAADELTEQGIFVSAAVSRQMQTVVPDVEGLRDAGRLPEKMVVHLGTNGVLDDDTINAFFGAVSTVPTVVVLTVLAPGKTWIEPQQRQDRRPAGAVPERVRPLLGRPRRRSARATASTTTASTCARTARTTTPR